MTSLHKIAPPTRFPRGRTPTKRLISGLSILVFLTGCAGIPEGGPVVKVEADHGTSQSTVRYSPAGPAKDASPQQIVRGYLDAMLAYPVTTGTAASFLTPEAAQAWNSSAGVAIYVRPEVSGPRLRGGGRQVAEESASVDLTVSEDAALDRQGRFTRVGAKKSFQFHLVKSAGQWRISNPQRGFLINRKFFDDYYRPFNDYYFDRPGKRLIADPIYLAVGDQLSTALVSSLILGPANLLGGMARTYVPDNSRLRTSVPLRTDGLAEVQFREDLSSLSSAAQERISAQTIWTLRQVPMITGVRITGGDNVLYPGDRGIQSIDSWDAFGPRYGDGLFYGVQADHIVKVDGRGVAPVAGPWGKDARGALDIAVDSDNIAAIGESRDSLMIGSFKKKSVARIAGKNLLPPRWDDTGHVWAVDRSGGATRVRLSDGETTRTIPIGSLGAYSVTSFALAPNASRYAILATVGSTSRVFVGAILRDANDSVTSLGAPTQVRAPATNFADLRSISWATDTAVTFLADDSVVGTQVFELRIDGSQVTGGTASSGALLPDVKAQALVTAGGDDPARYVTDRSHRTWLLRPGGNWELLSQKDITGLTASMTTATR